MKILLIEPDETSSELYASALVAQEHGVVCANSAQKALDELDANLPDCIILEIDMLQNNGFEFLYEFNSHYDWSGIPVIVHSSVAPEKLNNMAVDWDDLNVNEYLYKGSTTLQELQAAVSRARG